MTFTLYWILIGSSLLLYKMKFLIKDIIFMMKRLKKLWFWCILLGVHKVQSDESVCNHVVTRTYWDIETFPVTYWESYKERCRLIFTCRRTRINSYQSHRSVQRSHDVTVKACCPGYEQNENDDCTPVCMKSCTNARCTKPNVCSCDPGYRPTKNPTHCEPVCSQNCSNGNCVRPDECECNFGYSKTEAGICQPVCTESCTNGICTAPETCVCLEGYIEVDSSRDCRPYCSTGCEHGICVAPETCECNEGFSLTEGRCLPICEECSNGRCVAPGDFQCNDGYGKVNGTCKPQCNNCGNGTCVSPGNCTCNKGFAKNSKEACVPHCKDGCQNGICIAPDVCSCNTGHKNVTGKCVPHCDKCVNGNCTVPGKCECLKGYEYLKNSTNHCIPACSPKCSKEENCTGPNECTCVSGFKKNMEGKCKAQCSSCSHGSCSAPEQCSCSKGYKHPVNATHRCIPICDRGCENGTCIAPNKCQCGKGYKETWGTCYPYCKRCYNGKCVAPGKCECLDGYKFDGKSKEVCSAICSKGCAHGVCIEPNLCLCDKGYVEDTQKKCVPKCDGCVVNSSCVEPGKCECHQGYKMSNDTSQCVPSCDECSHGTCNFGCVNGTCAEPGKCVCNCGFIAKVLEDNNTYCMFSATQSLNCTTEASKLEKDVSRNESMGSSMWMYVVGVTLLVISALVLILVLQRGRLRRMTARYRRHTYRTDSNIYEVPGSVLDNE